MKRYLYIAILSCFINIAINAAPEIHPGMLETIQKNESDIRTAGFIKNPNQILVDGKLQWTGFNPTSQIYVGADYIEVDVPEDWEMKEIDYSVISHVPIIRQRDSSCWAQSCRTGMNMAWNSRFGFIKGMLEAFDFSVQDVIDCSNYGSARSGGQLSCGYAAKNGLASSVAYQYTARDGKCRSDVERTHKLERAPMLRGKGGGFPNEREINYAYHVLGPMAFCGSASAMKSGGWVENPGGGGTNHCYGGGGMRWGPNYGKAAAWFHGTPNSWGEDWGAAPAGWGWYKFTSTPGGSIKGQRIATEIQVMVTGLPLYEPGPKKFTMVGPKSRVNINMTQGKYKADKVKKALLRAGFKEEASK